MSLEIQLVSKLLTLFGNYMTWRSEIQILCSQTSFFWRL